MNRDNSKTYEDLQDLDVVVNQTKEGRKIDFDRNCEDKVEIFRRVNKGTWIKLCAQANLPFVDKDEISKPASVEYDIQIVDSHGKEKFNKLCKFNV